MIQDNVVTEVVPGMTVEEIRALYFNGDALREPRYRVYQLNTDGYRYYYRFGPDGMPEFYPSVTTILKRVMPTPPQLLEWMIANGKEGATEKRDLAAAYGTFMHAQFEGLLINRTYDFDNVPAVLSAYMERENIPERVFNEWVVKIRRDVLAFAQFVRDWNVRPLAVEIALVHPEYGYAGCLDLPCEMTDPKTAKKFTAIVDFKSGRKGFFEEHELQLGLYKQMWENEYPDTKIERLFNFSPKDWRKEPTYNLKDQTMAESLKKIPHIINLALIADSQRENAMTIVRGVLDLDKGKISDNIVTMTLAELVKQKTDAKAATKQVSTGPATADFIPPKPVNIESNIEPEKPIKTENKEKRLIRAGGGPTPYDVCDNYCREKNCDYRLGEHGKPCDDAKKRAGYVEPESDRLPWEKDIADGTGIEVEKTDDGVKVTARYFEPAPEQAAKDNLLNEEIEL